MPPKRDSSPEGGDSAPPGRPPGGYFPRTSSLKTPQKAPKAVSKSADAYARNFNSTRRSTQKGDYFDGPPRVMPETYTVQSKKRAGEDRNQPINVPLGFDVARNLQPGAPAPSSQQLGVRRTQSLHKPKPSSNPFLVHDRRAKRYVSLAAVTGPMKRTASGDQKLGGKDSVRKRLFEKELAARAGVSNYHTAVANQASDGEDCDDESVMTTSGFESIGDYDSQSDSDNRYRPESQKRQRLDLDNSTTTSATVFDSSVDTTPIIDAGAADLVSKDMKVENTGIKDVKDVKANEATVPDDFS